MREANLGAGGANAVVHRAVERPRMAAERQSHATEHERAAADTQDQEAASRLTAEFKLAMRQLAGGVALVSTQQDGIRHGLTATAVSSLTMDPPALVVCVNRSASAFEALTNSRRFCVNLLGESHADLALAFASKPDGEARFANGTWRREASGLPRLEDGIVSISCRLHDLVEFGTHAILIGAVQHLEFGRTAEAPLIYLSGKFGGFEALPA